MGLDMYLEVRQSFERNRWGDDGGKLTRNEVPETEALLEQAKMSDLFDHNATNIYDITISGIAAYWRKDNHIHAWFVDNVQGGKDDCGEYYVSREKLERLRDTCREVLSRKSQAYAEEHLPTTQGFFFGSTDYDQYYWGSLEYTADRISELLELTKDRPVSFYYQSSW